MNLHRQTEDQNRLTVTLATGNLFVDYLGNVFCWLQNSIFTEKEQDENFYLLSDIIKNCFESSITTLNCAKYILDKFCKKNGSKEIKLKFNPDLFISSKTLFIEIATNKSFTISSKLENEYLLLRAVERSRTKDSNNSYEKRKIHYSKLNRDYNLLKY